MNGNNIFVIGHKNPDTDSICSAIAYANLKNQLGTDDSYVAKRAGEVSNETKFVLDYFNVKSPRMLEYVGTQVSDLEIAKVPPVHKDMSIKEVWNTMQTEKKATLAVAENGHLVGIITVKDVATANMDIFEDRILSLSKTSYKNIIDTLEGEMIVGESDGLYEKGKILIGASHVDLLETIIDDGDILITGNRFECQFCAIEMNVGCIVVCLNSPVSKTIQKFAKDKGVRIISTPHDTYMASRLISQSVPVSYFMRSDKLVVFGEEEYVSDIKNTLSTIRHRDFPIVSKKDLYSGMFSRRDLLKAEKKRIIMVDHNEKSQAVDGVEDAEILEIIDHHRLGAIETTSPVYFRNQPVGCTCTIVYDMYMENNIEVSKEMAGLMCSAIISDTLMFRSPTCTNKDRLSAEALAKIADINIGEYAEQMFRAGSNLKGKSIKEIFYQDFKTFHAHETEFGVGQISSLDKEELIILRDKIIDFTNETFESSSTSFFLLTNIIEESSILVFHGEHARDIAEKSFHVSTEANLQYVYLKGVVSRKKQFVPKILTALES